MQIPNDFFTLSSFTSLGGCTFIVLLVTGFIGNFMNAETSIKVKKWFGPILSIALAFGAASLVNDKSIGTWIIAPLNGILIYASATGSNSIFNSAVSRNNSDKQTINVASSQAKVMAKIPNEPMLKSSYSATKSKGKFTDRWW